MPTDRESGLREAVQAFSDKLARIAQDRRNMHEHVKAAVWSGVAHDLNVILIENAPTPPQSVSDEEVERWAVAIFDAHRARYPERVCPASHGWEAVEESTREHWRAVAAGALIAARGARA